MVWFLVLVQQLALLQQQGLVQAQELVLELAQGSVLGQALPFLQQLEQVH